MLTTQRAASRACVRSAPEDSERSRPVRAAHTTSVAGTTSPRRQKHNYFPCRLQTSHRHRLRPQRMLSWPAERGSRESERERERDRAAAAAVARLKRSGLLFLRRSARWLWERKAFLSGPTTIFSSLRPRQAPLHWRQPQSIDVCLSKCQPLPRWQRSHFWPPRHQSFLHSPTHPPIHPSTPRPSVRPPACQLPATCSLPQDRSACRIGVAGRGQTPSYNVRWAREPAETVTHISVGPHVPGSRCSSSSSSSGGINQKKPHPVRHVYESGAVGRLG